MKVQGTELQSTDTAALLINREQKSLDAYREKDEQAFRKHLAEEYVGVSDDGFTSADDDVAQMHKFDLARLDSKDQKLVFPAEDTGILTYTMMSEGTYDGESVSTTIHVATVWVKKDDDWQVVLHTESIAD